MKYLDIGIELLLRITYPKKYNVWPFFKKIFAYSWGGVTGVPQRRVRHMIGSWPVGNCWVNRSQRQELSPSPCLLIPPRRSKVRKPPSQYKINSLVVSHCACIHTSVQNIKPAHHRGKKSIVVWRYDFFGKYNINTLKCLWGEKLNSQGFFFGFFIRQFYLA